MVFTTKFQSLYWDENLTQAEICHVSLIIRLSQVTSKRLILWALLTLTASPAPRLTPWMKKLTCIIKHTTFLPIFNLEGLFSLSPLLSISEVRVYLGVKTCELFLHGIGVIVCVLYIVSELFLSFFVLRHWWVSQVFTPKMSQKYLVVEEELQPRSQGLSGGGERKLSNMPSSARKSPYYDSNYCSVNI